MRDFGGEGGINAYLNPKPQVSKGRDSLGYKGVYSGSQAQNLNSKSFRV